MGPGIVSGIRQSWSRRTPGAEKGTNLVAGGPFDSRLKLAYINQYREWLLGGMLALALAARLLGVPVSTPILVLLGLWFVLALGLVRLARITGTERRLCRVAGVYSVLELMIITLLARAASAAEWLALLFYVVTVLFASMVLPRRGALAIAFLAASGFGLLLGLDSLPGRLLPGGWVGLGGYSLFANRGVAHPFYLAVILFFGALGGYALIGLTLTQFARMFSAQAHALHSANRDLVAAGQELRLHRDHLEELVQQRTAELEQATADLRQANQDLRRLNQLKSNFLANVSHELRTPLTSIRSFSELLLTYPEEALATRLEFLQTIVHETDRLTRLINEVLDLARIEAGRAQWRSRPVRLEPLVREGTELFRLMAEQKGLRLETSLAEDLPPVLADPDRLRQVIANLLSNALKFTAAGSIAVGTRIGQNEVVLFVRDSGSGITAEDLPHIFEMFHQGGDLLTSKPAGTGLGLAICREIVEHLGGRIWVESELGRGSTFYCAFAVAEMAEPALAG